MPQFAPDQCSFGDIAGYGAWDISHGREHIQFIQVLAANGVNLPDPDLLMLLTAGQARQSQVLSHYTQHKLLRQATGVQGVDLSQVNLDDPNDFYNWLGYHATEHAQLRSLLGLT
ncbi:MAG TPA: hypothetical protein VF748_15570 [Candidatus Acidoferrum sp.]